ncbi:Uma2 family endonuclease [Streptodolium elevatio]|uniref:Uma2 family endonuclease n=1 Tax=Streptodolium elevatio TaxID=3157996 RepID=A0ABV3DMC1_9ACTN
MRRSGLLDLYEAFLRENRPQDTRVPFSPVTILLPNAPDKESYVPDMCVIDRAAVDTHSEWKFPADAVHLVVEVVSAGRESQVNDRLVKPGGYASGPVPLYLLIDPLRREVTLFSDPKNNAYQTSTKVKYGDEISFPEPFKGVLDTAIFDWWSCGQIPARAAMRSRWWVRSPKSRADVVARLR